MLAPLSLSGSFELRVSSNFSTKISKLLKGPHHTQMDLIKPPHIQIRSKKLKPCSPSKKPLHSSPEKVGNAHRSISLRGHTERLKALPDTKPQIKIQVHTVEKIEAEANVTGARTLIDLENSTNDSSFANQGTLSSNNTPSPRPAVVGTPKRERIAHKIQARPARHLSTNEVEIMIKRKEKKNLTIPPQNLGFSLMIVEKDKLEFENELLFRKYRKHKVMKNLMATEEEQWEWASHGSSPTNKVRFVE